MLIGSNIKTPVKHGFVLDFAGDNFKSHINSFSLGFQRENAVNESEPK